MTLDCSKIAKEIAIVSGIFSWEGGRLCFILASEVDSRKKDQKKKPIEIHLSQVTNRDLFGVKVNICFLIGPLG